MTEFLNALNQVAAIDKEVLNPETPAKKKAGRPPKNKLKGKRKRDEEPEFVPKYGERKKQKKMAVEDEFK